MHNQKRIQISRMLYVEMLVTMYVVCDMSCASHNSLDHALDNHLMHTNLREPQESEKDLSWTMVLREIYYAYPFSLCCARPHIFESCR